MKVGVKYIDLKPQRYYRDDTHPSSGWHIVDINGVEVESFSFGIPYGMELTRGEFYTMDIILIPYVYYRSNLKSKIFRKISAYPFYPMYVVMGEVVSITSEWEPIDTVVVDAGIEIEVDCRAFSIDKNEVKNTTVGDYVMAMGVMLSKIVKE